MLFVVLSPSTIRWQSLFNLYLISALIVMSIVFAWFVYVIIRYRRHSEPSDAPNLGSFPSERGSIKIALIIAILLGILFLGLTVETVGTLNFIQNIPNNPDSLHIKVIGKRFEWTFVYPNGTTTTKLIVPAGKVVVLEITSVDVFHSFGIPALRLKADAIPGKINYLWFKVDQKGTYMIRCYELCGTGHAAMITDLVVV
ncbi:MAG: cytochrome c oxidase subunit II [Thermoprotei archaeon]